MGESPITSARPIAAGADPLPELSERQQMVLRAVVASYVADALPVSSATVCHLLPVALSSASVRNTMGELASLGLIEKPHASAGRVPTETGMRQFVERLLDAPELADYERRSLEIDLSAVATDALMAAASQLLSDRTNQLGFAMMPRIERVGLRHVSLVRVARDRVLVVLVPQAGPTRQRVISEDGDGDQIELDRMATVLNERLTGRSLREVRRTLAAELADLRSQANRLVARSLALGLRFLSAAGDMTGDLVLSRRVALISQPEFNDPDRIRGVFAAVETNERLLDVLARLMEDPADAVSISLGAELEEPGLRHCALVAVPYGGGVAFSTGSADEIGEEARSGSRRALGVLGVIGPSRMDYARIIPLVGYCSQLVTEKLSQ